MLTRTHMTVEEFRALPESLERVEVLSPSTAERDRGVKFEAYQRAGVRKYWLLDPKAEFLEAYTLVEGEFKRLGVFGVDKSLESPVLGQKIEIGGIFKR